MSSSSNSDEENSIEDENYDPKVDKDDETKLETDFKSLQVKEIPQASKMDEGITAKHKYSTNNIHNEEPARNTHRAEVVRNMDFSTELSAKQNANKYSFGNKREARPNNAKDETLLVKDPLTLKTRDGMGTSVPEILKSGDNFTPNLARVKKKYTSDSPSSSSSWRDPNHKYERSSSSRNWRNNDPNSSQASESYRDRMQRTREDRSSSFEHRQSFLPTFAKNKEITKIGNWTLSCAPDIVLDNGLTEVEHVRNCIHELYEQNGELFAPRRPNEYETSRGGIKINCYTSNYEDILNVAKVADLLTEKIKNYPYCFYYFYDREPMYMRTCEGELYKCIETNWKLINFNE